MGSAYRDQEEVVGVFCAFFVRRFIAYLLSK
jgi:hypothetical protein